LREVAVQDRDLQSREVVSLQTAKDRTLFEYPAGEITDDRLLLFVLEDEDGIQNQQPYRLSLSMTPDEAPRVAVALSGVGTAITPLARIPLRGEITDDYGLAQAWFQYRVDEEEPSREDLAAGAAGQEKWPVDAALDARAFPESMRLAPGQRMILEVQATDRYDLTGEPHVGASQRFTLDVVTPEELRAILEGRELLLRQRFEVIYNELVDTRDILARIEFAPSTGESPEAAAPPESPASAAPGDASGEETDVARRRLRVVRAVQNVERGAFETLGVATGFDEIREELVNNRIENDQVLRRLKDEIADPLRKIGRESMPRLKTQLDQANALTSDVMAGPPAVEQAIELADGVLVEMRQVLDKMLELESYNEVIEMLRAILEEQQRLHDATQQRRLERLLEPDGAP
jgi:hypothetical protein